MKKPESVSAEDFKVRGPGLGAGRRALIDLD
jgi:hypothetical protein